jgi:hypothetical protein
MDAVDRHHTHGGLTVMTRLLSSFLSASFFLAMPALAAAQSSTSGFAGVLGGLTFGTVSAGAVAGNAGVEVAPNLFVIGEIGYMRNVTPKVVQDMFDDFDDQLEFELGVPVALEISVPQVYGFGGLRWSPAGAKVSPFVEGGLGIGRVSFKIDRAEVLGMDIRDEIEDVMGDESVTEEFLFTVGGGVNVALSKSVSMDLGLRYTRLATDDPAIRTVLAYGAIKFGR